MSKSLQGKKDQSPSPVAQQQPEVKVNIRFIEKEQNLPDFQLKIDDKFVTKRKYRVSEAPTLIITSSSDEASHPKDDLSTSSSLFGSSQSSVLDGNITTHKYPFADQTTQRFDSSTASSDSESTTQPLNLLKDNQIHRKIQKDPDISSPGSHVWINPDHFSEEEATVPKVMVMAKSKKMNLKVGKSGGGSRSSRSTSTSSSSSTPSGSTPVKRYQQKRSSMSSSSSSVGKYQSESARRKTSNIKRRRFPRSQRRKPLSIRLNQSNRQLNHYIHRMFHMIINGSDDAESRTRPTGRMLISKSCVDLVNSMAKDIIEKFAQNANHLMLYSGRRIMNEWVAYSTLERMFLFVNFDLQDLLNRIQQLGYSQSQLRQISDRHSQL